MFIELVKKVNAIKIVGTSNLVKKADYNTKFNTEIEKKIFDHYHSKCITTQEFNKFTGVHFAATLAQAKLASKADIVNFVRETDFDNKLKNINKNVSLNKTEHLEAQKKLTDLTKKALQISEKNMIFC